MTEIVRTTPNGLHVTSCGESVVTVAELRECPFCGARRPFVQTREFAGTVDARVVCGLCHVSTRRATADGCKSAETGEDVTRDIAIEMAAARWNRRNGE